MSDANPEQHAAWNGDSGANWVEDADERDRVLQPVADALLEAAAPQQGEDVLDIGCGCGATTFAAADAVVHGRVTGLDISEVMLDEARARQVADEVPRARFVQADAQTVGLDGLAVDLAISRFGTMFFADAGAAFANIRTAVKPGGRLAIATWRPLVDNDWLMVPGTVFAAHGAMPEVDGDGSGGAPGMFAQSDADEIESMLNAAGFAAVTSDSVDVSFRLGADGTEAARYVARTGVGRAALELVAEADRDAVIAEVIDTLETSRSDDGVFVGGAVWITRARVD